MQGCCGYHYEYATPEDKEKEERERDLFWTLSGIQTDYYYKTPFDAQIKNLQNKISIARDSVDIETKNARRRIKMLPAEIEKIDSQIAELIEKRNAKKAQLTALVIRYGE